MTDTANLQLPLLAAAQAQKHITVNEALGRLDVLVQMNAISRTVLEPSAPKDGDCYVVPTAASGLFAGEDNKIAVFLAGGWEFLTPKAGWKIWIQDRSQSLTYDGAEWVENVVAISAHGAAMIAEVIEADLEMDEENSTFVSDLMIPNGSVVMALSGVVVQGFDGSAASWSLGVPGSENRYGSGLGTGPGAWVRGVTGQPQAYYNDTPIKITSGGGPLGSGIIRIAIHLHRFSLPRAD